MNDARQSLLRSLPAIDTLLKHPQAQPWLAEHPRGTVVDALQAAVEETRTLLRSASDTAAPHPASDAIDILARADAHLRRRTTRTLRRVINATGVVLHTGLGRAPLCPAAVAAVTECAAGYCNLELDLASGARGRRADHVATLLAELTGAQAATVVNNNAAATLLILNTVAKTAEVVVSRGQLVEIGGAYRLPEMMAASGATLREVGTTNRTRIADYERAIGDNTAALMRVHTSNYRVVGFTQETPLDELVALARRNNLTVIDDLGSGAMFDLTAVGLPAEPDVRTAVAAGADLVCFSGDKLLGGPQAGIIVGRRDLVARIEANPLMRTYRTDKMTLAALEATLQQYRDEKHAAAAIPSLALLRQPSETLQKRAQKLARALRKQLPAERFEVVRDQSVAGGGALPAREMETRCVAWTPAMGSVDDILIGLRQATPPVIARAAQGRVLFDARTIRDEDILATAQAAVQSAAQAGA